MINLPAYIESLVTLNFNNQTGIFRPGYVYHSIGITNKGNLPVKVIFSESAVDSYVVVDPNSYKEVAISSNYLAYEYLGTTATPVYNLTVELVKFTNEGLLTPRFPNLFVQDISGNYVLYNPLNTDGFYTETYNYGSALNRPYNSETMIYVDYWFNGQKLSSSDGNFYADFFGALIENFITSTFSYSSVNDVLRPLPGGQTSEIVSRIRNYWQQIDRPINDEYVGGWAKIESFNRQLKLLTFTLETGDKIEFPFTLLGFNIENLGTTTATVRVYTNSSTYTDKTINVSETYIGNLEPAIKFEVVSGTVKLSFSGYLVKLIEFAPIVNIYYPIGFDENSGQPNTVYTLFQNQLADFENYLTGIKFTGRVFKYKWVQHVPETREVWNADYYMFNYVDKNLKLPFEDVRLLLRDWYAYSVLEEQILSRVWDENYSVLGVTGRPKDINEVIMNDNIVVVLGRNFSSYTSGSARRTAKREFLKDVLINAYTGNYAGSLNFALSINWKIFISHM